MTTFAPRQSSAKSYSSNGLALAGVNRDMASRARRDIQAAADTGRFNLRDCELALALVAGAALCLGQLLHDNPERDDAEAADQVTEDLLRMFGLPSDEAHEICRPPLPDLETAADRQGATA
ncbi:hypothetical protein [Streptomyces sp. NPDC056660]|uniref:hypothetical protein n=1 Tax=Streptomyces sp. NPDC056660 TaxID=3345897 RepID=UPI00369E201E